MRQEITGHVVVLGLGRSGRAAAEYLLDRAAEGHDVRVTAVDAGTGPALDDVADQLRGRGCSVLLGADRVPADASLVVSSPGVPPASQLMHSARASGAQVISELEFAFRISNSPWVAVTGTNGKTTTTSLIAHVLAASGVPAEAVGNIGRAATQIAGEAGPATVLVAEVSSFQLALTERFRPRVSVLLNITPDHVDWHGSLEQYALDKARIFANQAAGDVAVVDIDDEGARPYAGAVEAAGVELRRVSIRGRGAEACLVDGRLVLDLRGSRIELLSRDELGIRGEHNVSNALAAAAAAHAAGASVEGIREGLRTFRPIEHRLEPVGVVHGVEYFNDSKATNPDAVSKALTAFAERPLIVLLGGKNKDNEFDALARAVGTRCVAAVLFGRAAPEIAEAFARSAPHVLTARCSTMADAVVVASQTARPGDVVLLSPACASFDEFRDYEHRGEVFRRLVGALGGEVDA